MQTKRAAFGLLLGLSTVATVVVARRFQPSEAAAAGPESAMPRPPGPAVPVVVELFTSEGCSSCPAADAVLARLEKTQPVAGAEIVPLALHVDYWNQLGWTDPFSSAQMSERQRTYARLGGGTYTPEAVVDGAKQLVGSRSAELTSAIAEAANRSHAKVALDVTPASAVEFDLRIAIDPIPGAPDDAEVIVAVTRARARVEVTRGENRGETLEHTAIVKDLRALGVVGPKGGDLRTRVQASAGEPHRVVVFVQERKSRRILGAATRPLDRR